MTAELYLIIKLFAVKYLPNSFTEMHKVLQIHSALDHVQLLFLCLSL